MKVNVLVTGVGQVIGIGIIKALKISGLHCSIIGTDCEPNSAGLHMVDKPFVVPPVVNRLDEYIKSMAVICKKENVQIIFLGSEPEIRAFSRHAKAFGKKTGTFVMVSTPGVIERMTDKWKTYRFLASHNLPVPATILPSGRNTDYFIKKYGFPLIMKPRLGTASRGVRIIDNNEQLMYFTSAEKNIILQEYLEPENEEYTVGVFLPFPGKSLGAIAARRVLKGGVTFRAEIVADENINVICRKAAEQSGVIGPCNIQLRKTGRGPVIFEINPRFSSTVAVRAHFGFNEPAMAVHQFVLKQIPPAPLVRCGTALRFWEEIYID